MLQFWQHGFGATLMDVLVRTTAVSRQGIYGESGGKAGLFLACLDAYSDAVVTPAFAQVEQPGADLSSIARFFEHQIRQGDVAGWPGPGCLLANTMTEVAPHDPAVAAVVARHNERLAAGFHNALGQDAAPSLEPRVVRDAAATLVVFANGLWSMSRTVTTATPLRRAVREMLLMTHVRLDPNRRHHPCDNRMLANRG
jgi:TetR/AcrR family transcriptional regulator, transcriptional repressor for nem operon